MSTERNMAIAGNRLHLIEEGPDRLVTLLRVINEAQRQLCLYFYIFAGDGAGERVRAALIEARRRGVAVTLMIDAFGSGSTAGAFFAPLEDAGARFGRFGTRRSTRYLIRNHQKMVIADGERAVIGGFNVEDGYFAGSDDGDRWCDLALMIEGPAVAQLQGWYDGLAHWVLDSPQRFRALRRLVRHWPVQDGPLQWLMGGPTQRLSSWARRVKADLHHGQRLDMIAAYFSPGRGMLRRITRIAGRGGARLIVPLYSDNMMTVGAARHLYARMIRRGVALYEYESSRLHIKLIVVDDVVYVGSANFDKRSLFLNVELMLRIEDAAFAEAARELVMRREKESRRIDREAYRALSGPVAQLRWLISYLIVGVVDYTVTRRLNFRDEPR
ncbi:MAG TPA: phosphatidylserine/phosphatidylglycerophosphate/cardiolipin synthase family protein [Sphingobium sp.]|uniref:phospholipase D-like domain-containing protein n=1 Tax=Sphingobium sp. TaxID=1912891 RepID=UPI002ED2359E